MLQRSYTIACTKRNPIDSSNPTDNCMQFSAYSAIYIYIYIYIYMNIVKFDAILILFMKPLYL